ncbi:fimbrial protein [Morganella morganii]|uniref:fimbrial protein n=1 Tax=Morganella morganii TaxID=582 RepID=UPI001BDB18AD|nr:fimbrial-like protein [Morganella morganii]ELT0453597.1 fimbrial-like protein [Morganella morganii]MBT0336861.1 fimbrial-like protein [Morganella morganii subsp. morganii]
MPLKLNIFPLVLFFLLFTEVNAGNNSQIVNFNATFYGGSCEVSAPGEIQLGDGIPVSNDSIPGDKRYKQFNVTLSGCQGYFMAPKLSVSGNIITGSGGVRLFADSTSTTKGYGVRLATDGNARFTANSNTAVNGIINASNWPLEGSDNIGLLNGPLEFKGYLSCGTCIQGVNLQGGELRATITFKFLYD